MNLLFTRVLVWFHAGVLILLLLWATVGNWISEQRWQTVVTPLKKSIVQNFPPRSADANAIQVQQLAANLGFSLASNQLSYNLVTRESLTITLRDALSPSRIEGSKASPLPKSLQAYLVKHRVDIEKMIDYIDSHEPPRWARSSLETRWARSSLETLLQFSSDAFPEEHWLLNYRRLRKLHRLLLIISLEADRQGQSKLANRSLTAAWNLMYSLVDQPLGLDDSMLREQAMVFRLVNLYSPDWQQRWARINPLQVNQRLTVWGLINANFIKEVLACPTSPTDYCPRIYGSGLIAGLIARPLLKPYVTFSAIDFIDRTQHFKSQDPCVRPPDASTSLGGSSDEKSVITWNFAYSLSSGWRWRLKSETLLQWEATNKILLFRERMAQSKKVPITLPDFEQSKVCPSVRWNYEVLEGGQVRITSSRITSSEYRISYTSHGDGRFKKND